MRNRVALVTGGAQGIGYEVAMSLARRGAQVAVVDVRADAAQQAVQMIAKETGASVFAAAADVSDASLVDAAFTSIERALGPVDYLINNAGLITPKFVPAELVSPEQFDRMLAVHVRGSFLCSARAMSTMKAQGYGRIIMISSLVGPLGFADRIAYATAKAGIVGMTRSLAVEGGPHGVTVNAVAPGWIRTPLIAERITEGVLDPRALLSRTPAARWGEARDVAEVIAALMGPEFDFVTGAEIPVDGGYRINGDTLNTSSEGAA
jgi:NAD(P)-dependent dehydrogenase (short-subunit alcohol dehydrogenase family)